MTMQLAHGGRKRAIDAAAGKSVAQANLYLGFLFDRSAAGAYLPTADSSWTLAQLAPFEIQVPGTGGYARKRVDDLIAAAVDSGSGYAEAVNGVTIDCFTTSAALAQIPSPTGTVRWITHAFITTEATSQASTNLDAMIWRGPLLDPLDDFDSGDVMRLTAGQLSLRAG